MIYALGEIALVVVGILIAVQIGDWNTQKQEKALAYSYLKSLRQDLEDQLVTTIRQSEFEIKMLSMCQSMLENYHNNQRFTYDSILANQLFILGSRKTFTNRSATYTEMVSSGSFSLIKDLILKNEILNYYQEAERITSVLRANNQMVDHTFPPKTIKYSFASDGLTTTDFLTQESLSKTALAKMVKINKEWLYQSGQKILSIQENELELLGLINYRSTVLSVNITVLENFERQTQAMKDIIVKALD